MEHRPELGADNGSTPEKPRRITILSDIHEPEQLPAKVDTMVEANGDINIQLGDAFDSALRDTILQKFKSGEAAAIAELSTEEQTTYEDWLAKKLPPIAAYWRTIVGHNPEALVNVRAELEEGYDILAEQLERLPNTYWMDGNVEKGYENQPSYSELKLTSDLTEQFERIKEPNLFYADGETVGLMFPWMPNDAKAPEPKYKPAVDTFFADVKNLIDNSEELKNVVIIAHGQPWKGGSEKSQTAINNFRDKVGEAGGDPNNIPFYMPDPYRKEILDFVFSIPENVNIKFLYGHVHNTAEDTQTAIPFKPGTDDLAMQWGVSKVDPVTGMRKTRHFDMYQLPKGSIYTVDLGDDVVVSRIEDGAA